MRPWLYSPALPDALGGQEHLSMGHPVRSEVSPCLGPYHFL